MIAQEESITSAIHYLGLALSEFDGIYGLGDSQQVINEIEKCISDAISDLVYLRTKMEGKL